MLSYRRTLSNEIKLNILSSLVIRIVKQ
jgi:hypothetical protein